MFKGWEIIGSEDGYKGIKIRYLEIIFIIIFYILFKSRKID